MARLIIFLLEQPFEESLPSIFAVALISAALIASLLVTPAEAGVQEVLEAKT